MATLDPKYDHYDFPVEVKGEGNGEKTGHSGHTTPQQDAQVHQLRLMLEAEGHKDRLDTLTLLRFLRARKFDVKAAQTMFQNDDRWRKSFGVDELTRTFDYQEKAQVFAYYPQYYHKTDRDGRPVYIEQLGKVDLEKLRKITTDQRMLQNLVVEYEKLADPRLPACSRKAGSLLETCCTIMDLKGVGLTKATQVYSYLKEATAICQDHYPERLGKLYIINAPWGFGTVWSVIKGFLDPVTVKKIHIVGSGYVKELLQQIPEENLPSEFGGKCRCAGGCALSDAGPWQEKEWARPPKWSSENGTAATNGAPHSNGAAA